MSAHASFRRPLPRVILGAAITVICVSAIGAAFLARYVAEPEVSPVGYDTAKYVWRSNVVADRGVGALTEGRSLVRTVNPDRPGYPVFSALVRACLGVEPFDLAFVIPAVLAVVVGLGAASLARGGLGEPGWALPAYAIAAGLSANVAMTAVGYADTLIAMGLVLAAAVPVLRWAAGAGGWVAALLLLNAASLIHWPFATVFAILLVFLSILLLPGSMRGGGSRMASPSVRLGAMAAGSVAAGAAVVASASPSPGVVLYRLVFERRLAAHLPRFALPVLGPLAAAGSAAGWLGGGDGDRRVRRWAVLLLGSWALTPAVVGAFSLAGFAVPVHRFLGFAVAVPILATISVVWLARWLARRMGRVGAWVGVAVVTAALAISAIHTVSVFGGARVYLKDQHLLEARVAASYLDEVGGSQPVIFVLDPYGERPHLKLPIRTLLAMLSGDDVRRVGIYLGSPAKLLAGRPTLRGNPDFDRLSLGWWHVVEPLTTRDPIILHLGAFNRGTSQAAAYLGDAIAPRVILLRGPRPGQLFEPEPLVAPGAWTLTMWAGGTLLLLLICGAGWSTSLIPAGWRIRGSIAPAMGLAALILAGTLADRVGVRLGGPGGFAVAASTAVGGWVPWGVSRLRSRADPDEGPEHDVEASAGPAPGEGGVAAP